MLLIIDAIILYQNRFEFDLSENIKLDGNFKFYFIKGLYVHKTCTSIRWQCLYKLDRKINIAYQVKAYDSKGHQGVEWVLKPSRFLI